jgi:hypothetical protein
MVVGDQGAVFTEVSTTKVDGYVVTLGSNEWWQGDTGMELKVEIMPEITDIVWNERLERGIWEVVPVEHPLFNVQWLATGWTGLKVILPMR